MKKPSLAEVLFALTFLFFFGVLFYFLQNDFWQDEVYTLVHFVFVPVHVTVTDYHSTNNHVLFSLLTNIVRNILGFHQLSEVLLHPYFLRCIPVAISFFTVAFFYRNTKKLYGKNVALLCSSIWLTTFPLLCFASQFRGYALSIFIVTLQFFYFLRIAKNETIKPLQWLLIFTCTSLSLLCLSTNIYIELSYLLLCFFLFVKPTLSVYFFNKSISRIIFFKIATAILAGCLWTGFYYKWMLEQQPANLYINTFYPFQFANLLQTLAIFYRFTGYRFYLFLFVAGSLIFSISQIKKQLFSYKPVLLPLFLFILPFVFFFVHGAFIIQRTFLSLIPFFVLLTGLSAQEVVSSFSFYNRACQAILILNLLSFVITFASFNRTALNNNVVENHQQDLVQHYYLLHFNELQASLLAKDYLEKNGTALYLNDGFGQTGIDYYLNELKIPYHLYNDSVVLPKTFFILTNLKIETEKMLQKRMIVYQKIISSDYQYNLFICHQTESVQTKNRIQ